MAALRSAGCSVISLAAIGKGCPDILASEASWPHRMRLLEVKDGNRPPCERRLTPAQILFHANWRGPIEVVTSVDEALAAMGIT